MKYKTDFEAFEMLCGNCAGVGYVSEKDVLDQARYWIKQGETVTKDQIEAALRYRKECYGSEI